METDVCSLRYYPHMCLNKTTKERSGHSRYYESISKSEAFWIHVVSITNGLTCTVRSNIQRTYRQSVNTHAHTLQGSGINGVYIHASYTPSLCGANLLLRYHSMDQNSSWEPNSCSATQGASSSMQLKCSSPCSQELATVSWSKLYERSAHSPNQLLYIYVWVSQVVLFLRVIIWKHRTHFSRIQFVLHFPLISSS
jgi:hypothetical protein